MQQTEKTAPKPEAKRLGILRLECQRSVVELQFQKCLFEVVVTGAVRGVNPRKNHWRDLFVPFQRSRRGTVGKCYRIADGGVCDILYACCDITDFAGRKRGYGTHSGRINPDFDHFECFARSEHPDFVARFYGAVDYAYH